MQIGQEKTLEYLNRNFLGLSKSSTDEDRYIYEYLIQQNLMSRVPNSDTITINNDGQDFIRNSNYWNPVPMDTFEWIKNITNQLKDGEKALDGYGSLFDRTKRQLIQDDIIEQGSFGYYSTLTSKGRDFINSGLSYKAFLINRNQPNPMSIEIGHKIYGPVSYSNLSIDALNHSSTQPITSKVKPRVIGTVIKFLLKNIVQIIIGVIIAALAFYLGFTKSR